MKKRVLIGLAISLIFLYFAFSTVEFKPFADSLQSANYVYLIPIIILIFITYIIRALRWKILLLPVKNISTHTLFATLFIGNMANNILPLRIGEILRALIIGKSGGISRSLTFATIIVERVMDIVSIFIVSIIVLFIFRIPEGSTDIQFQKIGFFIALFIVFFFIITLFLIKKTHQTLALLEKLLKPIPEKYSIKIIHICVKLIEGFKIIEKKKHFFGVLFLSFLSWFSFIAQVYILLIAFNLIVPYNIPIIASFIITIFATVAVILPTPGFIGSFHAICTQGLLIFNVSKNESLAYVTVLHAVSIIPTIVIGLIYFFKENIKLSQIKMEKIES